ILEALVFESIRLGVKPALLLQYELMADVRCGSKADEVHRSKDHCYSITSSARSRIDVGIDTPIALAIFRLSANSKLVGCSTGRSDGFAPLRIFATNDAVLRSIGTVSMP